jgi:hypothetical protein
MLLTLLIRYIKLLGFALTIFCTMSQSYAQSKTEGELVQKIVQSLQQKDSFLYAQVFPPADTMAAITIRKAPSSSDAYQVSKYLIGNPSMLLDQDSTIIKQASGLFRNVLVKGKKLGIHWDAVILSRYELEVLGKTRDVVLEAIAPERFVGYVFLEDMLTRKLFAFTLSDIMKMGGNFYGGELNYIYEASTKDAFNAQLNAEKIRIMKGIPDSTDLAADSTRVAEEDEDDDYNKRKQVVARKLYSGWLDGETPIDLYIRYIQGDCPDGICSWEAIFKFGDNEYVRQEVSKTKDGKWLFVEEETGGVMELELKGSTFTGLFSATIDKVDYDAELKERPMSKKKLESLDAIIEKDLQR